MPMSVYNIGMDQHLPIDPTAKDFNGSDLSGQGGSVSKGRECTPQTGVPSRPVTTPTLADCVYSHETCCDVAMLEVGIDASSA